MADLDVWILLRRPDQHLIHRQSLETRVEKCRDIPPRGRDRLLVVVKVPLTPAGLRAVRALRDEDITTNVTLCFSPAQALLAAKAGALVVGQLVDRLDAVGTNGRELIREIVEIYNKYDFGTEILVASCRHPIHVIEAARMGADIATCPPAVIDQMFNHPLTNIGLEKFLKDWEKSQTVKA